jgi:hypothetical protein
MSDAKDGVDLDVALPKPESPELALARNSLARQIEIHAKAEDAELHAQKVLRMVEDSYREALWGEITARLKDHGAYFCRMQNHVVVKPVRILYVEIEGHDSYLLHEILPICEDCQAGRPTRPTEKRDDGWYYKKDGWKKAEGAVKLLLLPPDHLLTKMAIKAGLMPPSHFFTH